MVFLIVFVLMLIAGIIWVVADPETVCGILLIVFGVICLVIVVVFLIVTPLEVKGSIAEYEAVKTTLDTARKKETMENVALQMKVIEVNEWIANAKYWAEIFPRFYPDEIMDIDPLR